MQFSILRFLFHELLQIFVSKFISKILPQISLVWWCFQKFLGNSYRYSLISRIFRVITFWVPSWIPFLHKFLHNCIRQYVSPEIPAEIHSELLLGIPSTLSDIFLYIFAEMSPRVLSEVHIEICPEILSKNRSNIILRIVSRNSLRNSNWNQGAS